MVQPPPRAGRQDQRADRLGIRVALQRHHHRLGRRVGPAAVRQFAGPGRQIRHGHRLRPGHRLGQWPGSRVGGVLPALGHRGQGGPGAALRIEVQGEVRDVGLGPAQRLADQAARRRHGPPGARLDPQVLQRGQAARPDHPLCRIRDRGEHAADRAVIVVQRAVGVGPVGLLPVAVPVHRQQDVLGPGRLAFLQHAAQLGPDDVPDLRPHLRTGQVQGRVLGAEQRDVRVVVQEPEVRAPPHDHREAGREGDPAGDPQVRRPVVRGPERGGGPVMGPHQRRHRAGSGEDRAVVIRTVHRRG